MRKPLSVTFDDLFGEFFDDVFSNMQHTLGFDALPCNEYLNDDHYVLEIAAAGFSKDEIAVQVDNGTLSVQIQRKKAANDVRKFITRKIAERSFRLSKLIPPEYDLEGITCSFKDGLLQIVIPPKKAQTQTVKTIAIS